MRLICHLFEVGAGRFPATAIHSGVESTPAGALEGLSGVASNPIAPNRAQSCNGGDAVWAETGDNGLKTLTGRAQCIRL